MKVKMDGQEHELSHFELDNDSRSVYLDLDHTICVHIEDVKDVFSKELEVMQVGCDDGYVKARIDSLYSDSDSKEHHILGLSLN